MQAIDAISLTRNVNTWLSGTHFPRILHVFANACNLINEHRDVLSIVSPQIGNGPFNLVCEDDVLFSEQVSLETQVAVSQTKIALGELNFNIADGNLWNPQPNWEQLHTKKGDILLQLASISVPVHTLSIPESLLSDLTASIVASDVSKACAFVQKISGLGIGLTPVGDDFIMGAILAAWIIHPPNVASGLVAEIANTAAPLTTSLSAAWIKSAGRGEAGQVWHDLFDALLSTDKMAIEKTIEKIVDVGHTSGADALTGFLGVFYSYAESI